MSTCYRLYILLFVFTCCLAASCSSTTGLPLSGAGDQVHRAADLFSVQAVGGSQTGIDWQLATEDLGDQTAVHVFAESGSTAAAFMLEVSYDASRVDPAFAEFNPVVAGDDSLTVELLAAPGLARAAIAAVGDNQLTAPAGQTVLTVVFANQPATRNTRRSSGVPANANSLSPLSWDAPSSTLSWLYTNPGDYDQNGEVGLSDILPLALNFGETGPFAADSALSQIDGSADGEISLADLSYIGIHYGNRIEGYNLFGSEDFSNVPIGFSDPSLIDPLATLAMSESIGDPATERLGFSYALESVLENGFYWVRPYITNHDQTISEGTRSNFNGGRLATGIPGGFNIVPVADLTLDYEGDTAPALVTLDAGASNDPNGWIAFFEWDFEGDGLYDALGESPTINHNYSQPGFYAPLVRVTDNEGSWDIFQAPEFELEQQVVVVTNIRPVADLVATVTSGNLPLTVGLIASGSHDLDGIIVNYRWDLDGDGTFELNSGKDPTIVRTFNTAGLLEIELEVTDDEGDQDTDTITIEVLDPDAPTMRPIVRIEANPTSGPSPLQVTVTTEGSHDPDGEIVRFDYDFNNDGFWDAYDGGPEVVVTITKLGPASIRVRGTDDLGEQNMAAAGVFVTHPGYNPPVPSLVITVPDTPAPVIVGIDASGTVPGRGDIVRYDFDLDNDGIYELYDALEQFDWEFSEGGDHTVTVRVTDEEGEVGFASTVASVTGASHQTLGNVNSDWIHHSLADIWNRPAIAWYDETTGRLMYTRSQDETGTGDWTTIVVDDSGDAGQFPSMQFVGIVPAISYRDVTTGNLKFAIAQDLDGLGVWTVYTVDGASDVDFNTSLSYFSNGSIDVPSISYHDKTTGRLTFANCDAADGSGTWSTSHPDVSAAVFGLGSTVKPAIVVDVYHPAVCYTDSTGALVYALADAPGGLSTWSRVIIEAPVASLWPSMYLIDSTPVVTYSTPDNSVRYARSDTLDGMGSWTIQTIDTLAYEVDRSTMYRITGVPVVAYLSSVTGTLRLAVSQTVDGLGDWDSLVINHNGQAGEFFCLTDADDQPAITYTNRVLEKLVYAHVY